MWVTPRRAGVYCTLNKLLHTQQATAHSTSYQRLKQDPDPESKLPTPRVSDILQATALLSTRYRTSIGNLSDIHRTSIEHLSDIYLKSIERLSQVYRKSIGNLSNIYRTSTIDYPSYNYRIGRLSNINRNQSDYRSKFLASTSLDWKRETISLICLIIFYMF